MCYIAELVHEFRTDAAKTRIVWVNIHLVYARTASEAYSKAVTIGKGHNLTYKAGMNATPARWRFRGLRELLPIHDQLKDGAELMFEHHNRMRESNILRMLRPKRLLTAFTQKKRKDG